MDKAKFYLNARGSLYELKSHLLVAKDLSFMKDDMTNSVFQEIDKLSLKLNNLINKTRRMKEEG